MEEALLDKPYVEYLDGEAFPKARTILWRCSPAFADEKT